MRSGAEAVDEAATGEGECAEAGECHVLEGCGFGYGRGGSYDCIAEFNRGRVVGIATNDGVAEGL